MSTNLLSRVKEIKAAAYVLTKGKTLVETIDELMEIVDSNSSFDCLHIKSKLEIILCDKETKQTLDSLNYVISHIQLTDGTNVMLPDPNLESYYGELFREGYTPIKLIVDTFRTSTKHLQTNVA